MRKLKFLVILCAAFTLSVMGVFAQDEPFDNDPATNPDANACYEGGSMEDKCNDDMDGDGVVTQDEIDWAWNCGWYLIRYENNMGGLPEDCISLLDGQFEAIALCLFDFLHYTGEPNTPRNVIIYDDENCTGEGLTTGYYAMVQADSVDEVATLCDETLGGLGVIIGIYKYPGEPEDLWLCIRLIA